MKFPCLICLACLACLLTSCAQINSGFADLSERPSLEVTPSVSASSAAIVGGAGVLAFGPPSNIVGLPGDIFSSANAALLYIIYDPLAPNWKVEEKQLNEDTFYLAMRAKSFRVGGDGETLQILKRRALQLQHAKAYGGYQILNYSESIESSTPFTHRVAEATFQLVNVLRPASASALKNQHD